MKDARKEDAGRLLYNIFYLTSLFVSFERVVPRLLYNIFYLTSLFVSFERVVPSLRVRVSWRPNITEIF